MTENFLIFTGFDESPNRKLMRQFQNYSFDIEVRNRSEKLPFSADLKTECNLEHEHYIEVYFSNNFIKELQEDDTKAKNRLAGAIHDAIETLQNEQLVWCFTLNDDENAPIVCACEFDPGEFAAVIHSPFSRWLELSDSKRMKSDQKRQKYNFRSRAFNGFD